MKNLTIADISFDVLNRYIERHAEDLAEKLWDNQSVTIRVFHRLDDDEWEATEWEDPTEEGDWELIEEADEDYIAEDDEVAELLREWHEDAAEYERDPYAYFGVRREDF